MPWGSAKFVIFTDSTRNLSLDKMSYILPYSTIEKSPKFLQISFGNLKNSRT